MLVSIFGCALCTLRNSQNRWGNTFSPVATLCNTLSQSSPFLQGVIHSTQTGLIFRLSKTTPTNCVVVPSHVATLHLWFFTAFHCWCTVTASPRPHQTHLSGRSLSIAPVFTHSAFSMRYTLACAVGHNPTCWPHKRLWRILSALFRFQATLPILPAKRQQAAMVDRGQLALSIWTGIALCRGRGLAVPLV